MAENKILAAQAEAQEIMEKIQSTPFKSWVDLVNFLEDSLDAIKEKVPLEERNPRYSLLLRKIYKGPKFRPLYELRHFVLLIRELAHWGTFSNLSLNVDNRTITVSRWRVVD